MAEDDGVTPVVLREPYLTPAELHRARDVFEKFASIDMCASLTLGITQNANESPHSVLWHNAPKTKTKELGDDPFRCFYCEEQDLYLS